MTSKTSLILASALIVLTLSGAGYVLAPEALWTTPVILSFLALMLNIGMTLHPTIGLPQIENDDSATFAALGPVGVFFILHLVWDSAAFVFALAEFSKITYAMLVISIGSILILPLYVNIGTSIVKNAGIDGKNDQIRFTWQTKLEHLQNVIADESLKVALKKLSDDIRFAPSAYGNSSSDLDKIIDNLIANLLNQDIQNDISTFKKLIFEISSYLSQRNSILVLQRTKT